jgi:hypothetical protein
MADEGLTKDGETGPEEANKKMPDLYPWEEPCSQSQSRQSWFLSRAKQSIPALVDYLLF